MPQLGPNSPEFLRLQSVALVNWRVQSLFGLEFAGPHEDSETAGESLQLVKGPGAELTSRGQATGARSRQTRATGASYQVARFCYVTRTRWGRILANL